VLLSDLVGKDVAILGAGREGQAAWHRLNALAPDQAVTVYSESGFDDVQPPAPGRDQLLGGPLDGALLGNHEVVIRSPGISPYREPLVAARKAGVTFTSGTNLWMAANPQARTLCITGTKGKSTTSALLAHLLCAAGARTGLAGNIGRPLLECDATQADWWVVELSSYQICDLVETPWHATVLNLSDEHLDWHGDAATYRRDKLRLLSLAPEGRRLINADDPHLLHETRDLPGLDTFNDRQRIHVDAGSLWDGQRPLPGLKHVPGPHNLSNLAAVLTILDLIGLRPEGQDLVRALETFHGLPHRLALVGHRGEVRLVDDSLSTTPVATLAALRAFIDTPVTVLLGGLDRGLDWSQYAKALQACAPHALIGLPDNGERILAALADGGFNPAAGMHQAADMAAALETALQLTPAGGVVLLSPGAPSFPHYQDYAARGRAFWSAASALGAVPVDRDAGNNPG